HTFSLDSYGSDGLFCVDSVAGALTLYNAGPASLSNKLWQTQCSTSNCSSAYLLSGYPATAAAPGPKAIIPSSSTATQPTATNQLHTTTATTTAAASDTANVPAIAGGVVGAVVLLALLAFAYYRYRYYSKPQPKVDSYESRNINGLPSTPYASIPYAETPAPIVAVANTATSASSLSIPQRIPVHTAQFENPSFDKQRAASSFFDDISSSQQLQQQQPHALYSNNNFKTSSISSPPLPPKFEILDMTRVHEWSVEEAAAWIFRNGGGEVGYIRAKEERITGHSLLSEKIDDIMNVIPTEKFGDKAILRVALVDLQNTVPLP
ncbi:hypothetical protein HK100_010344, partial [Physocladia obscura]